MSPLSAVHLNQTLWAAPGEPKSNFVCSKSLKSERAISSFCLPVSFTTSPPSCQRVLGAGMARALQAARSFSCIQLGCHKTRWAPFNPISEIHSDAGKKGRKKSRFYFTPVRHLPISLEVRQWHQLMTVGQRRRRRWHKCSMFQASGGIMRVLLLERR